MQNRIFLIRDISSCFFCIIPRPRGGEWLDTDIRLLCEYGVNTLVSLLEFSEIRELGLSDEPSVCCENGIEYFSYPIPDRDVPESSRNALIFFRKIYKLFSNGRKIVIHCRQGIGRSALVAASILVMSGESVENAFKKIETARGCRVPDTKEQKEWVVSFRDFISMRNEL